MPALEWTEEFKLRIVHGYAVNQSMLCIVPQVCAADDVQVAVALALQAVVAEIREYPKAVGGEHAAQVGGDTAHPVDQPAAPDLQLAHVLLGHNQKHHRHPGQLVDDDDYIFVQVADSGGFLAGDYFAEDAVGSNSHRKLHLVGGINVRARRQDTDPSAVRRLFRSAGRLPAQGP